MGRRNTQLEPALNWKQKLKTLAGLDQPERYPGLVFTKYSQTDRYSGDCRSHRRQAGTGDCAVRRPPCWHDRPGGRCAAKGTPEHRPGTRAGAKSDREDRAVERKASARTCWRRPPAWATHSPQVIWEVSGQSTVWALWLFGMLPVAATWCPLTRLSRNLLS